MVLHAAGHYGVTGHRGDPVAPAGRVRPEADRRAGPVGRGRDPPRRLPQRVRGRLRRRQQHRADRAHRGQEPGRLRRVPRRQAAPAGPPAQPLHHPSDDHGAGQRTGGFINRYVFPDGELEAVGTIVSAIQDTGFEVRHEENFREHYARTCAAWGANLDAHWDEAVAEVGEGGPGCGGCTWPARGSVSSSGASSCTRSWRCAPRTGRRGCRWSGSTSHAPGGRERRSDPRAIGRSSRPGRFRRRDRPGRCRAIMAASGQRTSLDPAQLLHHPDDDGAECRSRSAAHRGGPTSARRGGSCATTRPTTESPATTRWCSGPSS